MSTSSIDNTAERSDAADNTAERSDAAEKTAARSDAAESTAERSDAAKRTTPASAGRNGRTPEVDVAALLAEADLAKRRRWPLVLVGACLGGVATLLTATYIDRTAAQDTAEPDVIELAVAEVTSQDLMEEIEWTGTLGYGEPVTVVGSGGTITAAASQGATLGRGDVLASVDNTPVVVLYGGTPFWRTMAEGTEGPDVLQLEANLAALGYDPDQTVDIDETFTANTELMVQRWQESLGIEQTGVVDLGSVVAIEGPSYVVSVGAVGSTGGGAFATLTPTQVATDLVGPADGVIADVLPLGTPIADGAVVYRIDEVPVVAVWEPLDDDHDAVATVDDVYYHVIPEGSVVDAVMAEDGLQVVTGGPILTASASRLSVAIEVEVSESDEFAVGQEVTIELADATAVAGVVDHISSVIPAENQQASPTVQVTIAAEVGAANDQVEGPVTVHTIGEHILDATVIPTRALIALAEGGFAVEKVDPDGNRSLIGIELGTFDDGVVQVTSGDLAPGDQVVVPA